MPIYAYRCATCGHAQDVLQKMSDPLLSVCPACGAATYEKQLTAAGFQLKGSGWYVTDFRNGNTGAPAKKDGEGKDGDATAGDKAAGADKNDKADTADKAVKPDASAAGSDASAKPAASESANKPAAAPAPAPSKPATPVAGS